MFSMSSVLPAATWARHARATRRRRPATALHKHPAACLGFCRSLPVTTGTALLTIVSVARKLLAIVSEQADRCSAAAVEHEHASGEPMSASLS